VADGLLGHLNAMNESGRSFRFMPDVTVLWVAKMAAPIMSPDEPMPADRLGSPVATWGEWARPDGETPTGKALAGSPKEMQAIVKAAQPDTHKRAIGWSRRRPRWVAFRSPGWTIPGPPGSPGSAAAAAAESSPPGLLGGG